MEDTKKYTDIYLQNQFELNIQVKYRRKMVLQVLEKYSPKNILEIGCGMEPIFKYLDISKIGSVTIVEPGKAFCDNAKNLIKKCFCEDKVNIIEGLFEETYSGLEKKFDFILCSGLLPDVENPRKLIKAVKEICKQETIVHINVPNAYSFHRLLALQMGLIENVHQLSEQNVLYQQTSVYDIRLLLDFIDSCGFQTIESGSYFCKPFTHQQMQEMIEAGIINKKMLDGLNKLTEYLPQFGSEIYVNVKRKEER